MTDQGELSDEIVVQHIQSGDRDRYAVIMNRYQEKLLRYANFMVQDADQAADVVQEAFIKAFINLQAFNTKKKFSSWIYRIVHNQAVNHLTKVNRETMMPAEIEIPSEEDIELNLEKKEIVARVEKCLSRMPIRYSEPLALYYLEEKSYEEISDILRLPMGTVATRMRRAKAYMKILCQQI